MTVSDLGASVLRTIRAVVGRPLPEAALDSRLSDLGVDSLVLVALFVALDEEHTLDLLGASERIQLSAIQTVSDVVAIVREHRAGP